MAKDNKSYGKPEPIPETEEKQFGLKEIEMRMVQILQSTYFTNLSNFLSFIALDRLAYPVTENTQFRIEDGKLYIKEGQPPQPPESKPDEVAVA